MKCLKVIKFAIILSIGGLGAVQAETITPRQLASVRAVERVAEAQRDGLPVDTAIELVVERDKLCVTSIQVKPGGKVRFLDAWCIEQKGAFAKRKKGLDPAMVRGVRNYVYNYSTRGKWDNLLHDVLEREDIFPEIQHLAYHDDMFRLYLLKLIVGHKAAFVEKGGRSITLKN